MSDYFSSPLFKDQLLGWVRTGLAAVGGMLVQHGYLNAGSISPEMLSGLAMVVVTCSLSAVAKFTARRKLVIAQVSTPGMTETQIDAKVASGLPIPSVIVPANQVPKVVAS